MINKTEATNVPDINEPLENTPDAIAPGAKKIFVEPEVTVPVDILEATTFFQVATSGATN